MIHHASAEKPTIVEVQDLRKTYRSGLLGGKRLEALRGVSLNVHAGEVFGLLGPNGAGKTTLIKTLLGIVRKSSGRATLFSQPAGTSRSRNRIGYLPENLRVEKHHTARTALHFYGKLSRMPSRQIRERTDYLLEKVGLQGRDQESVRRFSKGMYQRLGLAQALLHDPDLLVLDEPTDGLDPVGRSEMRKLLLQLRAEGKTIFLNSHILQEVEAVCDRVAIMAQGTLRGIGSIKELTAHRDHKRFQLLVLADPQAAVAALPAHFAEHAQSVPWDVDGTGKGCKLVVRCGEDHQIDACVDALRAAQLSIRQMKLETLSLEEAFFAMVGDTSEVVL